MPLPSTVVIGNGWAAHHRPVVTGAQTAVCNLTHPGGTGKSFDASTGTTTDTPNSPYVTGAPCHLWSAGANGAAALFGEQYATTIQLIASVDWTAAGAADVKVDDVLAVTAVDDNGDPTLVGRLLRVRAVGQATVAWERLLGLTDDQG